MILGDTKAKIITIEETIFDRDLNILELFGRVIQVFGGFRSSSKPPLLRLLI